MRADFWTTDESAGVVDGVWPVLEFTRAPARRPELAAPVFRPEADVAGPPQGAYAHVRHDIIDLIPNHARSVLDAGCSDGATGRELKRLDPSRRLVGMDLSPDAVRRARETYNEAFVCNLEDPGAFDSLGDETFDAIIAPDVLEHLRDPERTLRTLARRLRPDGVFVVSLPNIQHVSGILAIAAGRFPRHAAGLFDETHLRWFTRREAETLFHACGLRVTTVRRNLKLTLRRSGRPLWPVLGLLGDFFAIQLVFQLRRMDA